MLGTFRFPAHQKKSKSLILCIDSQQIWSVSVPFFVTIEHKKLYLVVFCVLKSEILIARKKAFQSKMTLEGNGI